MVKSPASGLRFKHTLIIAAVAGGFRYALNREMPNQAAMAQDALCAQASVAAGPAVITSAVAKMDSASRFLSALSGGLTCA